MPSRASSASRTDTRPAPRAAGVDHGRVFLGVVTALAALAWAVLFWWGNSPYGRYLDHDQAVGTGWGGSALVVAGWTIMTIAMMLPTALPLVRLFARMTEPRRDRSLLLGLLVGGYLGVWVAFGAVIHVADGVVHEIAESVPWIDAHAWVIGAATLALAGLYQFSGLKEACLAQCRSPYMFVAQRWHGTRDRYQSFKIGLDHGLFCVGCCWTLMLLMFAVGVGNLGWMLVLGAVMAAEKNLPVARRMTAPLGGVLLALAVVTAAVGLT